MGQRIVKPIQMQPIFGWDLIHKEYVQGFVVTDPETGDRIPVYPTYEDLANKHGCHIDTIRHKAIDTPRHECARILPSSPTNVVFMELPPTVSGVISRQL